MPCSGVYLNHVSRVLISLPQPKSRHFEFVIKHIAVFAQQGSFRKFYLLINDFDVIPLNGNDKMKHRLLGAIYRRCGRREKQSNLVHYTYISNK